MKKIIFVFAIIIVIVLIGFLTWELDFKKNPAPQTESQETNMDNNPIIDSLSNDLVDGLQMEVLQEGEGNEAKVGDTVAVHYTGYLENGEVFDSNIANDQPFSFTLGAGRVIKGWDLGVLGMKVGEKRKLTIAPELAYGEQGAPGAIPANATLIFEVELLAIQ